MPAEPSTESAGEESGSEAGGRGEEAGAEESTGEDSQGGAGDESDATGETETGDESGVGGESAESSETADGERSAAGNREAQEGSGKGGVAAGRNPGGSSTGAKGPRSDKEEEAGLDKELDERLSEFDEMLIREQEVLAGNRVEIETEQASGSGGYAGGGGFGDDGDDFGDDDFGDDPEAQTPAGGDSGSSGEETGDEESGAQPGAPVGADSTGTGSGGAIPPDVGDGSDDDIIARQLREAAMNEEDPELREKLWQEYRDYKDSTKGGGKKDN